MKGDFHVRFCERFTVLIGEIPACLLDVCYEFSAGHDIRKKAIEENTISIWYTTGSHQNGAFGKRVSKIPGKIQYKGVCDGATSPDVGSGNGYIRHQT